MRFSVTHTKYVKQNVFLLNFFVVVGESCVCAYIMLIYVIDTGAGAEITFAIMYS